MDNYSEMSYKRYKQYRLNRYRYEQEQKIVPLTIVLAAAAVMCIWQYIVLTVTISVLAIVAFLILEKSVLRKMKCVQNLVISSEEAKSGTEIEAIINNTQPPTIVLLKIPPKAKSGQKYVAKNVEIEKNSQKKKVNIYFTIEVKN